MRQEGAVHVSAGAVQSAGKGLTKTVAPDLAYIRLLMVNAYLYGPPAAGDRGWVMIDTGLPGSAPWIVRAAAERFGEHARPSAIVLTHGHIDHVGALRTLADQWDVPIYAHALELPYLTGRSPYPPPDPTVGGGALAVMSPLFSRGPIDVSDRVRALPEDGSVPEMDGWRWIHTPGHTPGHVSLFRDTDRLLVVGDAFVTTKQESMLAVLEQRPEIHGPPWYYTPDWAAARRSVEQLAALEPAVVATGHGRPLEGAEMQEALHQLARDFNRLGRPAHGRYVGHPAVSDATGVVSVPPAVGSPLPKMLIGLAAALVAAVALRAARR